MTKKLHTCPTCGVGGFMSLKAHRCKGASRAIVKHVPVKSIDVELVAAPNEKKLAACTAEIQRVHGVITGKTRKFQDGVIYDLVELGLYFMQAKAALGHGDFLDFVKLETVANLGITDRSARNYMNAARNAGLTEASTAADVKALRKAKALHGMKAGELYRLQDAPNESEEPEPTATKWNLIRDAAVTFREASDNVLTLKEDFTKKAYSTVCARALRTLEELTGTKWAASKDRNGPSPFREHGDVYELGS